MRPAPAQSSPWVFACAAVGLLAALWWLHHSHAPFASTTPLSMRMIPPSIEPQPANGPYAAPFTLTEKPHTPAAVDNEAAQSAAVLAVQVELSQLASEHQLALTSEQLHTFAAITNTIQAARRRYEASIAQMLPRRSDRLEMVVPMYSEVGDDLRSVYYQALRVELGDHLAADIQRTLGADLETMFADFGASEQGLEVAVDRKAGVPEYTVNSTAVFWAAPTPTPTPAGNSAITFAVHRETHLLPVEDPAGTTWGAFVQLFASQS